jgi:hypothetical protein
MHFYLGPLVVIFAVAASSCRTRASSSQEKGWFSTREPHCQKLPSHDMRKWFHSQIGDDRYGLMRLENRGIGTSLWLSGVGNAMQVSKSKWNSTLKSLFWRKDSPTHFAGDATIVGAGDSFYGEVFVENSDENTIELRQETFPVFPGVDPTGTWDAREDKFRLFMKIPDKRARLLSRKATRGRVVAPITLSCTSDGSTVDWVYNGWVNTYQCLGWDQFAREGGCSLYQQGVNDSKVFVEVLPNFSLEYDGKSTEPTNDPAYTQSFDYALAINQEMNRNEGRERFIFGFRQGVYFGIIRWDNSIFKDGKWVVTQRAITRTTYQTSEASKLFEGIERRAIKDH